MSSSTIIETKSKPVESYSKKISSTSLDQLPNIKEAGQKEFFWSYTEEPHKSRRQEIIKKYPQVLKLCGPEPLTKWIVLLVVSLQVFAAYILRNTHPLDWKFLILSYVVGAVSNQNLFLAIHEISHNLAFKSAFANRLLAIFANLPIGIPYSASFRPYHLTHHKSLGIDGLDVDIPTAFEAFFFNSILGKAFFCTFQIFFYALRPMFIYNLPVTNIQILNIFVQFIFDYIIIQSFGWYSMFYFLISSFFAGSLHPIAAHFIAEHYIFVNAGSSKLKTPYNPQIPLPETYSYYGPLNILTYNVGLHNEHHDFPAVPWTRLPMLNKIAKEFYKDLPHHKSWTFVIWQFIWDSNVSLWCRLKRREGGRKVGSWNGSELGSNEMKDLSKEGVR